LRNSSQQLITVAVIAATWGVVLLFEWLAPLRRTVESKLRRSLRNLTLSGISALVALVLEAILIVPVARWVSAHEIGLLHLLELPAPAALAVAVVLLDYTLWWWHWVSHHVPLFWRFHLVHHIDRDLDASTALRFHFGEHMLSFLYRCVQVTLIGATLPMIWAWQAILFASILFHHSNMRIPAGFERVLVKLVVTPRMHGIHHSDRRGEAFTNFSSLLSVWDRLHRTLLLAVPQAAVTIGVPAYSRPEDVTIGRILVLPFRRMRDDWSGRTAARVAADRRTELVS
jgi:sterol desaturase/sphingolipid hydroxylase (fatty acid hydroxylase superfamily)